MKEIPNDQPINEIHEVRRRISARFNHDPARLVAYYMKLQEQHQARLIETPKTTDGAEKTPA